MAEIFREQAKALIEAGADLITLETFLDIKEIRAAVIAIRELSPTIPVIAMLTFDNNGRSVLGTSPEAAAITLEAVGADIVGSNCGLGVDGIYDILAAMRKVTCLPLISQANAGLPHAAGRQDSFPRDSGRDDRLSRPAACPWRQDYRRLLRHDPCAYKGNEAVLWPEEPAFQTVAGRAGERPFSPAAAAMSPLAKAA